MFVEALNVLLVTIGAAFLVGLFLGFIVAIIRFVIAITPIR